MTPDYKTKQDFLLPFEMLPGSAGKFGDIKFCLYYKVALSSFALVSESVPIIMIIIKYFVHSLISAICLVVFFTVSYVASE